MRGRPIVVISILLTIVLVSTFSTLFAENRDIVWNGFDLEVLNTYDVQLIGQNSAIEIYEDKLIYTGEYIIKNKADKTLEAILGLPSSNLENIQITDKGNSIKYYNRNGSYIEDKYPSDSLPKADKWHTASLWFKNGETRIINLRYEAKLTNDSKGIFSIRFNKSKGLINSDASMIVATLNEFYPYNVLDTIGISDENTVFCSNNRLTMEMNKNSEIIGLDYELVDKMSIDRLDFSADKKLKSIAASFRKKDYDAVNALCDEYINNPGDPAFRTVQVKYVKAEAYRKQANFEKYVEIIKGLDLDKLYPDRLKYKILYDIDKIFEGEIQDSQLIGIMGSLQAQALDNNEYIGKWMQDREKNYIDAIETIESVTTDTDENKEESIIKKIITFMKLENLVNKIMGFKFLPIIVIVGAFLFGYFLGRRNKKRKNNISYYTYKR